MSRRLVIDLLRHGACSDGDIYRGRTDSPLSEQGWAQLDAVMAADSAPQWRSIYCSPLQRCRLPAQQLAERLGVPLDENTRLRELDFGIWDGRLQTEIWEQHQDQVLAFWQDPIAHPPPGGESLLSLQQRVAAQLQQWLADDVDGQSTENADSAGSREAIPLLCVTHGGVIRSLLCQLLGMPITAGQQLSIDYGSLTRIELYPEDLTDGSAPLFHAQIRFINRLPALNGYAD